MAKQQDTQYGDENTPGELNNPKQQQPFNSSIYDYNTNAGWGEANTQTEFQQLMSAKNRQAQLELDRALYRRQQEEDAQKKSEEEQQKQKLDRMGVMFFSILLLLCIVGDLVDFFTVGTLGWLIGLFIDGVILLATGMSKAGRKQFKRIVVGLIGESIPVISVLPFRSIFLIWGFLKSRSSTVQKLSSHLNNASPVVDKVV